MDEETKAKFADIIADDESESDQSEVVETEDQDTEEEAEVSNEDSGQEPEQPTKFKTSDGKEYTPDDVEKLYHSYRSLESEFTRRNQEMSNLNKKLQELEAKNNTQGQVDPTDGMSVEDKVKYENVRKQLKEFGLIDKDEFQRILGERDAAQQKRVEELRQQARERAEYQAMNSASIDLSNKYSGKRGEPKFDAEEVAQFLGEKGINFPEDLRQVKELLEMGYEYLHKDALKQIDVKKKPVKATKPKGAGVRDTMQAKRPSTMQQAREAALARLGGGN